MSSLDSRRTHKGRHAQHPTAAGEAPARLKLTLALSLLILLVVFATILVHRPVLSAQAVSFDDEEAIVRNRLIQHPSMESVGRFFSEVLLSSVVRGYYRPLTLTSLMLDWAMGARLDNLRVFHRTSLALHLGSTVLVILLCYQVFHRPIVAAMVGLIFGVHPLTVEPIAWVMERKTILAAFFAFGCLNAYVRFTRVNRGRWYGLAIVCYLLSLLAKPTGTPLPLMLLLMDYWPLKRFGAASTARVAWVCEVRRGGRSRPVEEAKKARANELAHATPDPVTEPIPRHSIGRRAIIEKIPFFALSVVFAVLACVCEERVKPLTLPATISPLHLPLRLCWLTVFYPCKVFLPIHLSLAYTLPQPLALRNPVVVLAVAGTIILIATLAISHRWTPALWVGAVIFGIGVAPTMGFVGYSWVVASDKYVYLPGVGLLLILGWALERIWSGGTRGTRRVRHVATVAAVVVAAGLLAAGTRRYLSHWQTTMGFHDYLLASAPSIPEVHNIHGIACARIGNSDRAILDFSRAIELGSNYPDAYYNRGNVYLGLRLFVPAIEDFTKAIELKPNYADAYNNRAVAYYYLGEYDRAWLDVTMCRQLGSPAHPDFVRKLAEPTGRTE